MKVDWFDITIKPNAHTCWVQCSISGLRYLQRNPRKKCLTGSPLVQRYRNNEIRGRG